MVKSTHKSIRKRGNPADGRTIDGDRFWFYDSDDSKKKMSNIAESERQKGARARLIKVSGVWNVYSDQNYGEHSQRGMSRRWSK